MIAPGDDIDRIMAVMQAAFDPVYGEAWSRRQIEDALLVGNCFYGLVASTGEAPDAHQPASGFCLSRYGFEEEELLLLGVDPRYRRRGLADRLLHQFERDARSRGARRLLLEMRRGNPAEALYLGHGFLPVGERLNYYRTPTGDRLDAITFCLEMQ